MRSTQLRNRFEVVYYIADNFYVPCENYDGGDVYTNQFLHVQFYKDELIFFKIDLLEGSQKLIRYVNKQIKDITNADLQP
jgi:hypothetical protein